MKHLVIAAALSLLVASAFAGEVKTGAADKATSAPAMKHHRKDGATTETKAELKAEKKAEEKAEKKAEEKK